VGKLDSAEKADITNIIGYGCLRICIYIYNMVYVSPYIMYIYVWRNTSKNKMEFI